MDRIFTLTSGTPSIQSRLHALLMELDLCDPTADVADIARVSSSSFDEVATPGNDALLGIYYETLVVATASTAKDMVIEVRLCRHSYASADRGNNYTVTSATVDLFRTSKYGDVLRPEFRTASVDTWEHLRDTLIQFDRTP